MDENLVNDIIQTRNIIRKKYNALKRGHTDDEAVLEHIFKPITAPLNKLTYLNYHPELSTTYKAKKIKLDEIDDDAALPGPSENVTEYTTPMDTADVDEERTEEELPQFNLIRSTDKFISSLNIDPKEYDYRYGPHLSSVDDTWEIGSLPFSILNKSNIIVGDNSYPLTPGLIELLFLRHPSNKKYNENDIKAYLEIIETSNVLHRNYDKSQQHAGNKSYKYKFIVKLLTSHRSPTGYGLMNYSENKLDYVYWDDPNELVERLILLKGSQQAGHTNHNNEINSILEELREAQIIL